MYALMLMSSRRSRLFCECLRLLALGQHSGCCHRCIFSRWALLQIRNLDITLARLHRQLDGEQLLGALMFSCGGRGPSRSSMMGESVRYHTFQQRVPGLPCLGFYAGGRLDPWRSTAMSMFFRAAKLLSRDLLLCLVCLLYPSQKIYPGST